MTKTNNIDASKSIKLDGNETSLLSLFWTRQAYTPSVVMMLPEFGSVTPRGYSPSIENCMGYVFWENSGVEGKP